MKKHARISPSSTGRRARELRSESVDCNVRRSEPAHREAIAWIKANYTKPLRVEDLAQTAGMSVSTFHHHFRVLTALSPLQYQKQIRLQAARGRMLMDGLDAASAAFAVGYESASQFNREYWYYKPVQSGRYQFVGELARHVLNHFNRFRLVHRKCWPVSLFLTRSSE